MGALIRTKNYKKFKILLKRNCNTEMRVLLVGGGVTNSLISYFLKDSKVKFTCWEKARGLGGRFATKRNKDGLKADHGAQYLTRYEKTPEHDQVYKSLIEGGVITPFTMDVVANAHPKSLDKQHFVAGNGANTITKHFFAQNTNLDTKTNFFLKKISVEGNQVIAETRCGHVQDFDVVVVTIPPPQLLTDIEIDLDEETSKNLESVKYSARYALMKYYDDGVIESLKTIDERFAKYKIGYCPGSVIRYWSQEGLKRSDGSSVILFHTDVDFGEKYKECNKDDALDELEAEVEKAFPNLPKANETIIHKWKFSQVLNHYPGSPGCVQLTSRIILAGDSYAKTSNFDGCTSSAISTFAHIKSLLS